jgi:flavin-dependent dehydrogenase
MIWDAVVIGAGPAGAVSARELARGGARVLLVDRAHFPRPKVCGCCVNGSAIGTLSRLGLSHVLANAVPLREVKLARGARSATVPLPAGVALSREAFDTALVEEAVRAGAEFRPGTSAKLVELIGGTGFPACAAREVRVGDELERANVVIVATGLVGNDGTPEAGSRIGAGAQVPADCVPAFYANGTIFMATGRGGYVGLVRVEDGRLDVAAAFDAHFVRASGSPGAAAEAVLRETGWPVPSNLAALPWKGTPALTRRAKQLAGARWFAVGDAAGYVEPFTGEGMAWAVASAAALAPITLRAAREWHPRFVREWEAAHRRAIGARQRTCKLVSRVLRSPALTALAVRALGIVPALARPVVSRLNRPPVLTGAPA